MGFFRWYVKSALAPPPMPKRATSTVGERTHRLTWADRHAGYRMKCSCGWIDPKNHWGERGAIEAGNWHVRAVKRGARQGQGATEAVKGFLILAVVITVVVLAIVGNNSGSSGSASYRDPRATPDPSGDINEMWPAGTSKEVMCQSHGGFQNLSPLGYVICNDGTEMGINDGGEETPYGTPSPAAQQSACHGHQGVANAYSDGTVLCADGTTVKAQAGS
jgi:hypothetical protein